MHILKRKTLLLLSLLSGFCLSLSNASAQEFDVESKGIYSLSLKSLSKPEMVSLNTVKHKHLLISFFEPECTWCYRQLRMLNKLQQTCEDNIQSIMIGVHGTRQALQREFRLINVTLPAFETSEALLAFTGNIEATPITFLVREDGVITHKLRGYMPNHSIYHQLCPSATLL